MALHKLREKMLVEYLNGMFTGVDAPEEMMVTPVKIAKAITSRKKLMRRESDIITHEKILGYIMIELYDLGHHQGLCEAVDHMATAIRNNTVIRGKGDKA